MSSNHNIHNSKVHVTQHAYIRAKQRCGWNSTALERMSKKAFESGLKRSNTKGLLKKYLDDVWAEYRNGNNLRLYGEMLFVFSNHSLVTIWNLPVKFRSLAKVFRAKNRTAKFSA